MRTLQQIKRIIIFIVGMTVLLVGIAMIVLPGPAFVVIPMGLAILGLEFAWARHWLAKAREMAEKAADKARGKQNNKTVPPASATQPNDAKIDA